LISIVMPLYNSREYLEETIRSVLAQTYQEWELLIVDDCSNDGSYELALEFFKKEKRIHLFRMPSNSGGPAAPRNHGIQNASGEYIAFLDADDVWHPEKLSRQMEYLRTTGKKFTSAKARLIDSSSRKIHSSTLWLNRWRKLRKRKETLEDLLQNNFIVTSSVLIRKEILFPFREDRELVAVEDLYLWLEIFHRNPHAYIFQNEELLDYRLLNTSISQRNHREKQNTKTVFCIMKFLLEYDQTHLLGRVRWSMCKSQLGKLMKLV